VLSGPILDEVLHGQPLVATPLSAAA